MVKGLILTNAYTASLDTRGLNRFRTEFAARGVKVDILRNNLFASGVFSGGAYSDLDYDFCLYLDKDKYVSQLLQRSMPVFNNAAAIEICDDKMQTHIALSNNGIPMPDTLPGLLCYDASADITDDLLDCVQARLGLPVVVKLSYGSTGNGVFLANDRAELKALCEKVKLHPHLFQKFIAQSRGRDIRVIVIGGKCVGAICRTSDTDFRSNAGLGGRAEACVLSGEIASIAERTAKLLKLDYCGIDFLPDPTPLVCEVNSNAFFDAFESATKINVAGLYVEHILNKIGK